jgi:hypothetical protein
LADDSTSKERVLRPDGESGAHSDRWTRGASTRPHMYRLRELHRERWKHAGAPDHAGKPSAEDSTPSGADGPPEEGARR